MMDNLTANKSHTPCQSAGQNAWSSTLSPGSLFNPLASSQNLSLGLTSNQRPSYNHLQASNLSCMSNMSTLSSTHHPALYKASHISSSSSSNSLFANTGIPSSSHSISFAQQSPHTSSMLLTANQGKNIPPPSLPQTNPANPCRPQQLPLLSPHDPYKASFQPPLTSEGLTNGLQDLPRSLSSCGQCVNTSQATFEKANAEFASHSGTTQIQTSSTTQQQHQMTSVSHCTGAANKSVPDATARPNKVPTQEGIVTPPASNESRRLALLHQRAQLLKQLKELDKLLESIPSDDSSDEQSEQTATQSQLHLSAYCLSPVSFDEHSETCDTPEDPVSSAESMKSEKDSVESEEDDSDPDYSPKSESDFSDFPSDPDGGSDLEGGTSDESCNNSPSTHTKGKPSLSKRKKAKLESSSLRAKSVISIKQTHATNQRKSSETLVLPSSNGEHRVYDRRNYCVFCSKPMSKMARHLQRVHSDKPEVAAAFQHPQNSRERQKIWNRLTKQGNFVHNKMVLKTGKGKLAVRKRPSNTKQARDFLHCLYCRGFYIKKALHRHMRLCPERVKNENEAKIGRKRIASQCVLEIEDDLGITEGFKSVLSQMTYNDVTQAIMDDKVILQFGELLYKQHGSDAQKHDQIRQSLRQVARLVLEAQKITPLKKLEDFFVPSNFSHVVCAVNVLAGYDPEKKTYSTPSLAIKLGYHLQKTCSIVEGNAVESGDTRLAECSRKFLSMYQKNWNKLISSGALSTLRTTKVNTDKKVPYAQDVKRLNFHMEDVHALAEKKLRDSPSTKNYTALVKVMLARTIIFNRVRAKEISSMQVTAFMSRKKSNLDTGMDVSVSDLERTMCGFFERVDARGKCGRMIPLLLKPSFVSALELLVKVREKCGVPSENPFLFGRPYALSAYSGSECIQKYVKQCGAKDPEALSTAKLRKHYSKMLQLMNLDENEANQILGPNNPVRKLRQGHGDVDMGSNERLQPAGRQQAASWDQNERANAAYGQAEFYSDQAHGATTGANMTAPSTSVQSERQQPAGGQQAASWDHDEHSSEHYGQAEFYDEQACGATKGADMNKSTSVNAGRKGAQNQGKHKWEEAEVLAVERHMMHLIEGHVVPQKKDCIKCLEAEPEALKTRSWKGVKDYVRNRITALKRQNKSAKAKSTNSTWSGQAEQRQQIQFHWTS